MEKIKLELNDKPFQSLPQNCKLEIIVQKVCIETWFLGNRNFFVRNPQKNELLKKYIQYFDINKKNPEDLAAEFVQDKDRTYAKDLLKKTKTL